MLFVLFFIVALLLVLALMLSLVSDGCNVNIELTYAGLDRTARHFATDEYAAPLVMGCKEAGARVAILARPANPGMRFVEGGVSIDRGDVVLLQSSVTPDSIRAVLRAGPGCRRSAIELPALKPLLDPGLRRCRITVPVEPVRVAPNRNMADRKAPNLDAGAHPSLAGVPIELTGARIAHGGDLDLSVYLSRDTQLDRLRLLYKEQFFRAGHHRSGLIAENRRPGQAYRLGNVRAPKSNQIRSIVFQARHRACVAPHFLPECQTTQQVVLVNPEDVALYSRWSQAAARWDFWHEFLPPPVERICPQRLDDKGYIADLRDLHWLPPRVIPAHTPNHYHPYARYEMRSRAMLGRQRTSPMVCFVYPCFGHQATYDAAGALILDGVAAGSADRATPNWLWNAAAHGAMDVQAWLVAAWLDGNATHAAGNWRQLHRIFAGDYVSRIKNLSKPLVHEGRHLRRYLELRPPVVDDWVVAGPSCR